MSVKIGYQGMNGSNSQHSAENMVAKTNISDVEYIPLITSIGVVSALKSGEIDYGVMATSNVVAGVVVETQKACEGLDYEIIAEDSIPIHHCLFVKNNNIKLTDITQVASHIQALAQCTDNLAKLIPNAEKTPLEDTAIGAQYLAQGDLCDTAAALCRRNAGEAFNLTLIKENIEDFKENRTEFMLIKLK